MSEMFYNCRSLVVLPDISKWNVKKVKDMSRMFSGCVSLTSFPDILKWNINYSVNTTDMFTGFSNKAITDISKWNEYKNKFIIDPSFLVLFSNALSVTFFNNME